MKFDIEYSMTDDDKKKLSEETNNSSLNFLINKKRNFKNELIDLNDVIFLENSYGEIEIVNLMSFHKTYYNNIDESLSEFCKKYTEDIK